LARPGPRRTPVVEPVQRGTHGMGGLAQNLEQSDLIHGPRTLLAISAALAIRLTPLWQP
jgi:hypothetical protein